MKQEKTLRHLNEVYDVFRYSILVRTGSLSNSAIEQEHIKTLLKVYLDSSRFITEEQIKKAKEGLNNERV
jgi:hypothetical protein